MAYENVVFAGAVVAPDAVGGARARDLAMRLARQHIPYAVLVECRAAGHADLVIMDVEVEVPQQPVHDIRLHERIAVEFGHADVRWPEVTPLRTDFPQVPHLNLVRPGALKSMCLFEDPYREIRPTLTSPGLVEHIREWLRLTARGELHAADQPLEPLLMGAVGRIILPHAVLAPRHAGDLPIALTVACREDRDRGFILVAERATTQSIAASGLPFASAVYWTTPRTHGLLSAQPASLGALHEYLSAGGDDLLTAVRVAVREWYGTPRALDSRFVLIVVAPKTRVAGGPVESHDLWAFISAKTLGEVGADIGILERHGVSFGVLLQTDDAQRGQSVEIDLLNVSTTLTRNLAAQYSGRAHADDRKVVAIGAGALGSQVVLNAARIAYGQWTVVDHDLLLPHNTVRHALAGHAVGFPKALGVSLVASIVVDADEPAFDYINADVLDPRDDAETLNARLVAAQLIIDMSASIIVARHLARDATGAARRISLFLNPVGTDLVLLSESRNRAVRLDAVEMQYYRMLLNTGALANHLEPPPDRVRYGRSCRDVSVRLSQESVALFAAIGLRAIRAADESDVASIRVWCSNPETGEVVVHVVAVEATVVYRVAGWSVMMDEGFLRRVAELRTAKLPSETGGVLLGSFDLEKRIVYIVDTIPSPPDSEERPTWFIRGSTGLPAEIATATKTTAGQVEYIGEWHSHPRGHSCQPSEDDAKLFVWLTDHMDVVALPAVMMIAGDDGALAVFVGTMIAGELRDEHRIAIVQGIVGSSGSAS